jgi:di/tricarboxylate transporter
LTPEIAVAFAILIGALIVFSLDIFPIDFVAFSIMALVLLLGPFLGVTPQEAISGFSNPATVTILAMFILSAGIYRTGVINRLAHHMVRVSGASYVKQLVIVMVVVAPTSAFINNTAAVAILIPSVITLAREHRRAPSKLLIPLSYFSQLAGTITLIGTATNVLGSSLSAQAGFGAFGMFEFADIGLLIFATGTLYILFVGRRLLPDHRVEQEISQDYSSNVIESQLREQSDVHVLEILRNGKKLGHPLGDKVFQPRDILFVKTNTSQLLKITNHKGLAIESELRLGDQKLQSSQRGLLEVVIAPNSDLIGGTLESTNFRYHYNCTVIAIRKHGELIRERLSEVDLNFGDTLLLRGSTEALDQIKREPGFIVTEEPEQEDFRSSKTPIALTIIAAVVIIAAFGVPILVTAIVGCVLMVLTGCLKVNELHEAIRWDVIFLLAGVIPLGIALTKTGGAQLIANLVTQSAAYLPPIAVLGIFYILTVLLAEFISHSAAVVVMVPVGIATAESLGLDPQAFILASMFAASMSFSTPVGYQTNAMVYGPGGYKFLDYTRVGAPLGLLLAIVTPILIFFLWGL